MVLIEHVSEVFIGSFEAANCFAVFRELSQDRMMKVHWDNLLFWDFWIKRAELRAPAMFGRGERLQDCAERFGSQMIEYGAALRFHPRRTRLGTPDIILPSI
ncbi:MAG TPA: hypothetical protein VHI52_15260 [Verrucomicrobiae bacterium]|nr:hypothetical protein [Verrucomicrobiae bacterium]